MLSRVFGNLPEDFLGSVQWEQWQQGFGDEDQESWVIAEPRGNGTSATRVAELFPVGFRSDGESGANGMSSSSEGTQPEPAELRRRIQQLEEELVQMQGRLQLIQKESFERGYREAVEQWQKQAEQELAQERQKLKGAFEELLCSQRRLLQEAEKDIVELAIAIAKKILHREIQIDPTVLRGIVRAVVEKVSQQRAFTIRAHPSVAAAFREFIEQGQWHARVELLEDASVPQGTIEVNSELGRWDASIESQLEEIRLGLADRIYAR